MRRRHARRIRYCPGNRRGLRRLRVCLICIVAVFTLLSVQVIARSLRTAALNRQLVQMHTVDGQSPTAEIAAPPLDAEHSLSARTKSAALKLALMTMPNGSAIKDTTIDTPVSFHKTSGDVLPDMMDLLGRNPDTVGWIGISGIVHLPVVYRDNAYYLTHDFDGKRNDSGALFLDQGTPVTAQTQNLLIHGHSMYDGSMFGLLTLSTCVDDDRLVIFARKLRADETRDEIISAVEQSIIAL